MDPLYVFSYEIVMLFYCGKSLLFLIGLMESSASSLLYL